MTRKEIRQRVYDKYQGRCAYTGKALGNDWQIDHVTSQQLHEYLYSGEMDYGAYKKLAHNIDNLLPALKIVNHYKRAKDLEAFRSYMITFHHRLVKLPKAPRAEKTKRRIDYMMRVADAFNITPEKPFNGKFYFEAFDSPTMAILDSKPKQR